MLAPRCFEILAILEILALEKKNTVILSFLLCDHAARWQKEITTRIEIPPCMFNFAESLIFYWYLEKVQLTINHENWATLFHTFHYENKRLIIMRTECRSKIKWFSNGLSFIVIVPNSDLSSVVGIFDYILGKCKLCFQTYLTFSQLNYN